jgi:hypothetical protein
MPSVIEMETLVNDMKKLNRKNNNKILLKYLSDFDHRIRVKGTQTLVWG